MARFFTEANSEHFTNATSPIGDYLFTFACWFRDVDGSQNDRNLIEISSDSTSTFHRLSRGDTAGNTVQALSKQGGSSGEALTTATYTTNVWSHGASIHANTTRTAYLAGVAGTAETTTVAFEAAGEALVDFIAIGGEASTDSDYWDGGIAEAAIWNVVLTTAEIAVLAAGYSPLFVRPQSLVFYAPLNFASGNERDLIGGLVLTDVNTVTAEDHPQIIYPSAQILQFPPAGAAPAAGQTVYHLPLIGVG